MDDVDRIDGFWVMCNWKMDNGEGKCWSKCGFLSLEFTNVEIWILVGKWEYQVLDTIFKPWGYRT